MFAKDEKSRGNKLLGEFLRKTSQSLFPKFYALSFLKFVMHSLTITLLGTITISPFSVRKRVERRPIHSTVP